MEGIADVDLASSPFFGLLRTRLDQLSERQRLIGENIANVSTPGYVPRDLDTSGFQAMVKQATGGGGLAMARTNPGHMAPGGGSAAANIIDSPDSETTIDGNAVVMEDEVARSAENRMQFETGLALYQKGLSLVRMAIRAPGR